MIVPSLVTPVSLVLLCLSYSYGLLSSSRSSRRECSLHATQIVLFGPNSMRIHDNPILQYNEGKNILPVIFSPTDDAKNKQISLELKNKLRVMGGSAIEIDGVKSSIDDFTRILNTIQEKDDEEIIITYCKSAIEPSKSIINNLINEITQKNIGKNVKCVGLWDEIITLAPEEVSAPNLHFDEFAEQYKEYSLVVPKPIMSPKILFDQECLNIISKEHSSESKNILSSESYGEDRALQLLTEYLQIGDKAFSLKYASTYAESFCNSKSHLESITRLSKVLSKAGDVTDNTHFFQGEVLSVLLAPFLTMGCLSPRVLVHAKNTLFGGSGGNGNELKGGKAGGFFVNSEYPFVNRIRQEAVRRDWHQQLARAGERGVGGAGRKEEVLGARLYNDGVKREVNAGRGGGGGVWETTYHNWRGYIQREGFMTESGTESGKKKSLAFVLHGFGGSLDQMTGFAQSLSSDFTVLSFDSLGFGYSEKPPLSYNQYMWRDQVVDFILRECEKRQNYDITVMGNSIGGFTVASVAAKLSVLHAEGKSKVQCSGLVLMNSAGNIIEGAGLTNTPFQALFPVYKGPPSEALRAFGVVMFSLLQPRIEQMLVWLYPSNSSMVKEGLAGGILRDSQDPGASDVIAAGGKLPTPRPMNDLFREFTGPIIIAQGGLDPLNDAKGRAKIFQGIREGITVNVMPLGHCPMDENPKMVADTVIEWATRENIFASKVTAPVTPIVPASPVVV